MTPHQDLFRLIRPRRQIGRSAMIWMKLFHKGAVRPDDLIPRRALAKPQDLIRFIFGHGPGAGARLSSPRVALSLSCLTPAGKPAIEICFQKPGAFRIVSTAKVIEPLALRSRQLV